ncbi:MAG: type IV secretion system DNA-binding domain-containing protein [Proteobacteria bacterium]|nr:type IV secretion system DNA-binding domain-containing protein [Pseudomonadota bacterium]
MRAMTGSGAWWVGYLLALCGASAAFIVVRASLRQWLVLPLLCAPLTLALAIGWSIVLAAFPALPRLLGTSGVLVAGGIAVFVGAAGAAAGFARYRKMGPRVERGTRLLDAPRVWAGRGTLALAGQPVPLLDETKHFKLIGTTGTGKSTAIRALLGGALARGDRAMVADPDGAYAAQFFDPARGDVILNPFDERSARWDAFGELATDADADLLARALIPDHGGEDRAWRAYARTFLGATLRQLDRAGCRDVGELHRLIALAPAGELQVLLAGTSAAPMLADENARFFGSVRAIAVSQLAALAFLSRPVDGPPISIRAWVRERTRGGSTRGALFLPYRASQVATLGRVISSWMRLAIVEAMEDGEGDRRLWFVVDELDALGPIDGLKDALARLRKYGGRCVLGFQSIAQVAGTYGSADAQTIVENCGNTLILRCSAAENGGTARFASRLIGEREVLREQLSRNRGALFERSTATRTVTLQRTTESAVLPSEIEQLPDLCGYLKFASEPAWLRVRIGS